MYRLTRASRVIASSLFVAALTAAVTTCSDVLRPPELIPARLATVNGDGQSGTVAQGLANPLQVKVTTSSGTPVPGVAVTWTVTSGGGSVAAAGSTTDSAGVSSAVWTLGTVAGANTAAASLPTVTTVTPVSFSATGLPGAPTKIVYTTQPGAATAGTAFSPAVKLTVQDAYANTVTTATTSVTVAITGGTGTTGAVLGGTRTRAAVAGVATFNDLTIDKVGTGYTLAATATGLTGATSTPFAVSPGAPAQLVFTTQPSAATAGAANAPAVQVTVQDAEGNTVTTATTSVTMAITAGTGTAGAVLGGTLTKAASSGVATFSDLTVDKAGTGYTLSAAATGLSGATSTAFAVSAGAASKLGFTVQPSAATAGVSIAPAVQVAVQDALGNTVTGATTSITVAITGGTGTAGAVLGGTLTHAATSGVATFSDLTIDKAGTGYTLTASGTGVSSGASAAFTTSAAGVSVGTSTVTVSNATVASGSAVTLTLQAKDSFGNNLTTGGLTVVFSASGGTSTGTIGTTTDNGDGTYTASFTGQVAGTATTIAATIGGVAVTTTMPTVQVTSGGESTVTSVVSVSAGTVVSGNTVTLTLQAKDAAGNAITTGGATVVFTYSGGVSTGTIGATTDHGNGTYTATFTGVLSGTATTIGATIGGAAVTSTLPTVQVTTGPVSTAGSVVQVSNSTIASGSQVTLTLIAKDAAGNNITSGGLTVVFSNSTGTGVSTGQIGTTTDHGNGTYTGTFLGLVVGTATTIHATIGGVNVTSTPLPTVTVTPGPARKLGLTTQAAGAASGVAFTTQPVVAVQDSVGNTVTTDGSTVTMAVTGAGSPTVVGTATATAVSGVATYTTVGITGTTGSTYTLTFSDGSLTVATQTILQASGPAAKLALTTQAAGAPSGAAFTTQPVVEVRDAQDNAVTSDNSTVVTMTVSSGATVVGTATATASGGVATFATVGIAGTAGTAYTLTFAGGSLTSATQSITPTAGAASQLALTTQAAGAPAGAAFTTQPVVAVRDAQGNTVTTDNSTVVTMTVNNGGTTVPATVTATASSGVATFSGAGIIGTSGTAYTLTFAHSGLTSATQSITAEVGPAAALALTTQAAGALSGAAFTTQPVLQVRDAGDNLVSTDNSTVVTMTVSTGAGVVGTATATASGGVATFSNVGITGTSGTAYTLTFAHSGLTSATQPITPQAGAASQLVLTTQAAGAASGAAFTTQPVVAVRDAQGNTVTTDNSTVVTMTVNLGAGIVGTATATATSGVATFSGVGIAGTAGTTYTLTFGSGALASATQPIVPTPGAASQLVLTTSAAGAPAGAAFTTQPVVEVRDAQNNRLTGDNSTVVTMTVSTGASTFGTVTATASGGIATFSGAGIVGTSGVNYTLTFGSGSLTTATQLITAAVGPKAKLVVATPASGAASGAAFSQQPVVQVQDAGSNLVSGDNSTVVTMTVSGSATTMPSPATATASGGVATFSGVGLSGPAPANYTLTYASASVTSATQSVSLTHGIGTQFTIETQPDGAASGVPFTQQPVLQLRDAAGNPVPQAAVLVTATIHSGGGTLGGTTGVTTNSSGVATFTDLMITGLVGNRTLDFSSTLPAFTATSATFLLTPGPATQLVLTTPAAGAASGAAFTTVPVVEVQDAQGNLETADNATQVTMAVNPTATITGGSATVTVAGGVATFTGRGITGTIGSYDLTFSSVPAYTPATQTGLSLDLGAADHLALTQAAAGAASGAPFNTQPHVAVQDAGNNTIITDNSTTVTIGVSSGATLTGTPTTVPVSNGVATFVGIGINGTVSTQYTLTYTSSPAVTQVQQTITPTLGVAAKLVINRDAAGAASGSAFTTQPIVYVEDAGSNLETGDNATVVTMTVSGTGSPSTVPALAQATANGGVVTFSGAGISGAAGTSYTLTFGSGGLTVATQTITPTPGTPTHWTIETEPAGAASGVAFTTQPKLQLRDAYGNAVPQSGFSVTASIASGGGTLSGTNPVTTDGTGATTFTDLTITGTIGDRTLDFTSSLPTVTSGTFTLTPGPATHLALTTDASGAASGSPFTTEPVVEVRDAQENVQTAYSGSVTLAISGGTGNSPFVVGANPITVVNGVADFSVLHTTGVGGGNSQTYTLTYSSAALATATQSITVTTGVGTRLLILTQPDGAASEVALTQQPSLQLRDSWGNDVQQSGVIITAAVASGTGAITASPTALTNSSGVATFSGLTVTGLVGPYTLQFTSNVAGAVSVTSNPFTLDPGPAAKLALTTPAAGAASAAFFATQPVVHVEDNEGNTVTSDASTVTMTIDGGASTVPVTATATASSGVAQFNNVGVSGTVGAYTLTFSDGSLTSVTQPITITPGAADHLVLFQAAGGAVNGLPFGTQPVVYVEDAQNNVRTNDNGTQVTMTSNALQTTGTGTVTVSAGVASFGNVGINGSTSSGYTLTFSSSGLSDIIQTGVTPALGAASHLALLQSAAGPRNGLSFLVQPVVWVLDAGDNLVTTDNSTVTMGVSAGATVVGSGTAVASGGVATFVGVGITGTVGTGYTLTYSDGSLTSTSQGITAALGPATHLVLFRQAAGAASGAAFTTQPIVYVEDAGNNIETTDNTTTVTFGGGGSTPIGSLPVTVSGGIANFTDAGISGLVGNYTLTYSSSPGLTTPTQTIGLAAGVGTQFTITQEPSSNATSGTAFAQQPILQLRDGAGNPVSQAAVFVTASITPPGVGTLGGTATVQTDGSGVATFSGLSITGTGDYTLDFTASLTNPTVTSTTITLP